MPTWVHSFVSNRRAEIRQHYEDLRGIEIASKLGGAKGRAVRLNEPFWTNPRDYLRLQVYQLARMCLERGEEWIDALLAIVPGKQEIGDFQTNPFPSVIMAVELTLARERAKHDQMRKLHKLGPDQRLPPIRLSRATRSRMASDLMIAHEGNVPAQYLIGFLRQLGDEPTKRDLAVGQNRASFRQNRASQISTYFADVRKTYSAKSPAEAIEVVKAAAVSKRRLQKKRRAPPMPARSVPKAKRKARSSIRSIVKRRRSLKENSPDS